MARELPAPIADFIRTYIDSLEELEILLLLQGAPERSWTVPQIYEELRSNLDSIHKRSERLVVKGLAAASGGPGERAYTFHLEQAGLAEVVRDLANAYNERRVTVIESIFAKPQSPIQVFADAFRIRKDPNDR